MRYTRLQGTEETVSALGMGGSGLGSVFSPLTQRQVNDVLETAVACGINVLDTAPWYNDSEEAVGAALRALPADAFFLHTKVGRYPGTDAVDMFDFSSAATERSVYRSLERLHVDCIDLVQGARSPAQSPRALALVLIAPAQCTTLSSARTCASS